MGCDSVKDVVKRYDEAVKCCQGRCDTLSECQNFGASCIPRPLVPACGPKGSSDLPTYFDYTVPGSIDRIWTA